MRIPQTSPGNAQLTTTTPSAQQTQTVGAGKGIESLGGAVEKSTSYLYAKMDDARNFAEASKAELFVAQRMGELELRASTDTTIGPDGKPKRRTGSPDDFRSYDDELRKTKAEASKFFTNKEQADKFSFEYDKSALMTRNKIQNIFMKNLINEGQATTQDWANRLAEHYALSGNENALANIEKVYDNAVVKGFFDADVGENKKKLALKDARSKLFIHDLEVNPVLADERLKSNYYKFEVDDASKSRQIYDREVSKMKNDNEDAIIADELNGKTLDPVAITNLMNEGKIDAKWAQDKIRNMSQVKDVKTDPVEYENIKNMITGGEKSTDIKRAIESKRGVSISSSDADSLYYIKQEGKDKSVYQAYYEATHKQDPFWISAINSISNFVKENYGAASVLLPSMMRSLITSAKSGTPKEKLPEEALKIIKGQIIADNPSISNLKDIPNAKFDKDGYKPLLEGKNEAEPNYVFRGGKLVPNKKE